MIVEFIQSSYWGAGRTQQEIETSIDHSICFGVYDGNKQVGFARVVTDQAFFGFLADVFLVEEYRGHGLGKKLVHYVMSDPRLASIRRFMLATKDAHSLYEAYGFQQLSEEDQQSLMRLVPQ
jgi:N-acetylglutamate synthase-like GNAT family acetyltransferase